MATRSRRIRAVRLLIGAFMLASLLLPALGGHAYAASILYVKPGATGGCSGWSDACDLPAAIARAAPNSLTQIWVAKGTYTPTTLHDPDDPRTAHFRLKDGVLMFGGFAGGESAVSQRDWRANETILSGNLGSAGHSYHVVMAEFAEVDSLFDGFTVTGGHADGQADSPDWHNYGGGMYIGSGSPQVRNTTFRRNVANKDGGGIFGHGGTPVLSGVSFLGNEARDGGGIQFERGKSGKLTLTDSLFSGNYAREYGGALVNSGGKLTLTNVTFAGNQAGSWGGAIFNAGGGTEWGAITLANCILWGNDAKQGPQVYDFMDSSTSATYSLVQGGYPGDGNLDVDPRFVAAIDAAAAPTTGGDLHLRRDSPAIDAGNSHLPRPGPATDLDGNPRIAGSAIDMGAYEYHRLYAKPGAVGDCSSWGGACDLQMALALARPYYEIWAAAGTYTPTLGPNREVSFRLPSDVAVFGGFAGVETEFGQRDWRTHETILSGDIGVAGDSRDNSYHVVTATDTSTRTLLDGLIITGGNANGAESPWDCGGGIYSQYYGSLTMRDVILRGNSAVTGGGMCNFESCGPTLINVVVSGNTATWGGGIYNRLSFPKLTNAIVSGNTAQRGGGIYNQYQSVPSLAQVTLSGNRATGEGGGIYNSASSPALVNSILWGNQAGSGPQMYNTGDSEPSMRYSLVQGGYAGTGNVDANPRFVAPVDPASAPTTAGNLRLHPGSAAIDTGDDSALPPGTATDLAGSPRIANDSVDMGAYEHQGAPPAPVTVTLSASKSPSALGEAVTLTAAASASDGTPGGTMTFLDGAHTLGTVTLDATGAAAFSTDALSRGSHTLTALYGGDDDHRAGAAATLAHTVERAASTSVASSTPNPSLYGLPVSLSATVTWARPELATPSGTVTFKANDTVLGASPLDGSGRATLSTSSLSVGWNTIRAEYGGDDNLAPSSDRFSQYVDRAGPVATLASSANPSVYGQPVTFTATMAAPGAGTPSGTVSFSVGTGAPIAATVDASGIASCTSSALPVGTHTISAAYGGDARFAPASATLAGGQTVNKAATTTAIAGHSPEPSDAGVAVTVAFSVAAVAPGSGAPMGSVTVSDGVASCTGTVAQGRCALTLSTQGDRMLTATYAGDGSFLGSSGTATHRVASPPTADAGGPYFGNEGSPISLSGTGTDLPGEALSYRWAFGDGATGAGQSLSHTYNDDGIYSATLTVTDDRGASGTDTAIVTIHNVAPSVTAPGNQTADEGAAASFSLGSFADPGDDAPWAAHVDWGDGSSDLIPGLAVAGALPNRTHVYGRDGSYTVTIRVSDKDGATGTASSSVVVRNVAPHLSGQFDQLAAEGTLTSFNLGAFADPGADSPWQVRVEWGDGSALESFTTGAPGALGFRAHAYDDDGGYTVRVTVTDDSGADDTASFRAIVRNVAPAVTIDPHVAWGPSGTQVGLWAHATDPSSADTRAGFHYQWSLKRDGVEIGTGSADSLGFTIPAGDAAIYLADVQAKDKDGGIGSASWHMRAELRSTVDARIQILWPHGGAPVRQATLANLSAWLLEPGTLRPAALSGDPVVYLWRALNNGPAQIVASGVRRGSSSLYDFNNVDVSAARDARNKLFFSVSVAGVPTHSNVWVHAQDGRTWFPTQDVPTAAGYRGSPLDARIEILWPHGNAPVRHAGLANLTAMLFRPGTLESVSPDWSPTVRLWRALDNGVMEQVGIGVKRLVTRNAVTYPVWDFNNIDVAAAQDAAHKLIFTLTVDGVEAHSSVWVHGVDARTIFPLWDVVE